ncbi:ABC transporter permease [Lysinimonas soli]|uniref:Transport permease protein n=1 Tax=Lysinimonas soli TaxID=1074233 RepID=A0ABW0NM13_9MICO
MTTSTPARARWSPFERYRRSLWLLTKRDLKVRYSTSVLGYLWSIIDPLLMSGIYYFVFVLVFHRNGQDPYIVFLISGLLPWTWFNGAISDSTRAFISEGKLIRSTTIPRTIWVARQVLSKGIEFVASLPVLIVFAIATGASFHWQLVFWIPAIVIQAVLTFGLGLIIAPLVVFFRDLERAVKLILRLLFYLSPIVYGLSDLRHLHLEFWGAFNPLTGIIGLYRSAFFPSDLNWFAVAMSALLAAIIMVAGMLVFRRTIATVLKEI